MKSFINIGKKLTSAVLCLCTLCCVVFFPSCSLTSKKTVMSINDVKIGNDIFVYFMDKATAELGTGAEYSAVESQTVAHVYRYFKTNSLAHKENIRLTTAKKADVSQTVDATWTIYGEYYSKLGITRETLTKVFTADAYRDALMLKYYGKGGSKEVSEGQIYANFQSNYVVFQAITGYLTHTDELGVTKPISKNEAETLVLKFQNIQKTVSSGEQTMEEAAAYLSSTGLPGAVQTVVLHRDDTTFPEGFFDQVKALKKRTASIVSSNEFIFLVVPGEIDANSSYYNNVKDEILISLADDKIDKTIDESLQVSSTVSSDEGKGHFDIIQYEKSK